jgi:putative Holliday junction resolvase
MMGRILALDFGRVRTGIAVTDELQLIASGLTTVSTCDLLAFLKTYTNTETVDSFVVGLPKQMNNEPSESEILIVPFITKMRNIFPQIAIIRVDERFTSKMAVQSMIDTGLKKKHRRNKALVDEISATIILQTFLNTR